MYEDIFKTTDENAIEFNNAGQEIVSFYVDKDDIFHVDINPNLTPEEAGAQAADVFWEIFKKSLQMKFDKEKTRVK